MNRPKFFLNCAHSLLILSLFAFLIFISSSLFAASDLTAERRLSTLEKKLDEIEKSQSEVLAAQDEIIAEIKNLKIWVNKR